MSYIGSTFSLVAGAPATEDQAGYEALTFVEVGKVVSMSPVGDTYEDQSQTLLKTGRTKHSNGAADGGEVTIMIDGEDFTDAGVVLLEAAEGTNTNQSFHFASTAQDRYSQGIVRGIRTLSMDASTRSGFEVTIALNNAITRVAV